VKVADDETHDALDCGQRSVKAFRFQINEKFFAGLGERSAANGIDMALLALKTCLSRILWRGDSLMRQEYEYHEEKKKFRIIEYIRLQMKHLVIIDKASHNVKYYNTNLSEL